MKLIHSNLKKLLISLIPYFLQGTGIFGLIFCFAYFFCKFSYLPTFEKIFIVIIPWAVINLSLYWFVSPGEIVGRIITFYTSRSIAILFLVSLVATSIFMIVNKDFFPSWNQLEVSILEQENSNDLEKRIIIPEIKTYGINGKEERIPPYRVIPDQGCYSEKMTVICKTSENTSLFFREFSNNSISILFEGFPSGGKVHIRWNGTTQIVDTYRNGEDQILIYLPHQYEFIQQTTAKKIEILILWICCAITLFVIIQIMHGFLRFLKYPVKNDSKKKIMFISGVLFLCGIINLLAFVQYQNEDIFRLQRIPSNSLIDLDRTSHDNIRNFQVYVNIWSYFRGNTLVVPNGMLSKLRISEQTLMSFSRISAIKEINYDPAITRETISNFNSEDFVTILPAGVIPNQYELMVNSQNPHNSICLWQLDEEIYFIPAQDKLNCLQEND